VGPHECNPRAGTIRGTSLDLKQGGSDGYESGEKIRRCEDCSAEQIQRGEIRSAENIRHRDSTSEENVQ